MVPALLSATAPRTYNPGVEAAAASPVMSIWVMPRAMVESALLPDRPSVNSWNPEVRLTPQFSSGTRMVWVVTPGSKVRVPYWPTKP